MTILPAELPSKIAPSKGKHSSERQTFLIVLLAALMVILAVIACSWAATRALMPDHIGESGLSLLNADYSPWEEGVPQVEIDIPRLATAAARGEGDWSDTNLPAQPGDGQTEQGAIPDNVAATPTPTASPTASPTPTATVSGGGPAPTKAPTKAPTVPGAPTSKPGPTSPGSTSVPPTGVPPTGVPPTATNEPPTSVPPTNTDVPTPVPPTTPPPTTPPCSGEC